MSGKDVEIYQKPREILREITEVDAVALTEMTEWQHGFLCGLLKKYRPHKILEIGVSAGGTTAVILNALRLLELDAELFSVDYETQYYRNKNRRSGFLAEIAERHIEKESGTHGTLHLLTGNGIPHCIENIGSEIDFLILDTMHILPGELLDFLACLPFLSDEAVVVMHDIAMHYGTNRNAFATQLLLDTVVGEKIIGRDQESGFLTYPNIGAFQLNRDTKNYVKNIFLALSISWAYEPKELEQYRTLFKKHYSEELIEIFDLAVSNNKVSIQKNKERKKKTVSALFAFAKKVAGHTVYIYGNGKVGKRLRDVFLESGIYVAGHIVSDGQSKDNNTYNIDEIEEADNNNMLIVIGVGPDLQGEIMNHLGKKGFHNYIVMGDAVYREIMV